MYFLIKISGESKLMTEIQTLNNLDFTKNNFFQKKIQPTEEGFKIIEN